MDGLLYEILQELRAINAKLASRTAETLPDILTVDDIKKYLNVGSAKAYEIMNDPKITPVNNGRKKCIPKAEFLHYIDIQQKKKKLKLT